MKTQEPASGEWWMVQSNETKRMAVMMKTATGWASILNSESKPLKDYIQTNPIFTPLFKMVKA